MLLESSSEAFVPMNVVLTTFSFLRHGHVSYIAFMPAFLVPAMPTRYSSEVGGALCVAIVGVYFSWA